MKKYLFTIGMACLLVACTEESKVKDAAIEGAKVRFQNQMREDIGNGVAGKANLQKTAALVLTDRSEFSVERVQINGSDATAVVVVMTVPAKEREALIEIMAKLEEKKEANFNVSNALNLIRGQLKLEQTSEAMAFKLNLKKDDGWKVQP